MPPKSKRALRLETIFSAIQRSTEGTPEAQAAEERLINFMLGLDDEESSPIPPALVILLDLDQS